MQQETQVFFFMAQVELIDHHGNYMYLLC